MIIEINFREMSKQENTKSWVMGKIWKEVGQSERSRNKLGRKMIFFNNQNALMF